MAEEKASEATAEDDVFEVNAELQMGITSEKDSIKCTESLENWLQKNALSAYFGKMTECGITSVKHIQDVTEEDAQADVGMTKFEARRLFRAFVEWKATEEKKRKQQPSNVPRLVTNNQAVVVTLPPAFQGFIATRDGGKSVVVSSQTLQKKWHNLWYNTPLNPFQEASNSFILKMCESRQYRFPNQRSCELWARKERESRISLLLAVKKNTNAWTQYYKKKSIYGVISLLQTKYPMVGALTEDNIASGEYECCISYKEAMDDLNKTLKENEDKCEAAISETLNPSGSVKSGEKTVLKISGFYIQGLWRLIFTLVTLDILFIHCHSIHSVLFSLLFTLKYCGMANCLIN